MADNAHIAKFLEGFGVWNAWRNTIDGRRPDLSDVDFFSHVQQERQFTLHEYSGFNFSRCNLNRASFRNCFFTHCDFSDSSLHFSDLVDSYFANCNFSDAELNVSKIGSAQFLFCDFTNAELSYCSAEEANFSDSRFYRTKLDNMSLVKANFSRTIIDGALVYGTSAWDIELTGSVQRNIEISKDYPSITVPSIELAQFIALLVNNVKIREIIDTITSKVVLILGRFTTDRKAVLDEIKNELQRHGYVPVLFDFEGPQSRDLTETVSTLASMSKFVVVDLSAAKSVPQELSAIVPHFPSLPVQPILIKGESEYGMFEHFRRYPWVLSTLEYETAALPSLVQTIVTNCEATRR